MVKRGAPAGKSGGDGLAQPLIRVKTGTFAAIEYHCRLYYQRSADTDVPHAPYH